MPSFDIVSKIDMPSVQNGLDGVKKEISTRYDFKGSMCEVEQQEDKIIIRADDDLKRKQVEDLIITHLTRKRWIQAHWNSKNQKLHQVIPSDKLC